MRKLIFLDIDGVLNSHKRSDEIGETSVLPIGIDRDCLGLLKRLCEGSKAQIVISSTWRKAHPSADWFIGMFAAHGWYFPEAPIIGITESHSTGFRGDEVNDYFRWHVSTFESYVILDDSGDFYSSQPLVQVDAKIGLQEKDIQKALDILNKKLDIPQNL